MEIINRQDMLKKIVKYLESDKIVIGGNKHSYKRKYRLKFNSGRLFKQACEKFNDNIMYKE